MPRVRRRGFYQEAAGPREQQLPIQAVWSIRSSVPSCALFLFAWPVASLRADRGGLSDLQPSTLADLDKLSDLPPQALVHGDGLSDLQPPRLAARDKLRELQPPTDRDKLSNLHPPAPAP